ncbi:MULTISPECIES: sugar ABC transporter substrate-binding protein [unclassified Streptomyces]|uniref:ABC transporter substrate-binding protein n=1 Tax=unclassified Streptomyces TaxID=2593676 RepID=UPI000DDA2217|nr:MULTISPECIES: sugar ABC transporter substrate-binding protein [unclassified Streptomyces]QZZ31640.1 sugar ABC transporter substrate-binding protein [Streptomyces sp. ST1015]
MRRLGIAGAILVLAGCGVGGGDDSGGGTDGPVDGKVAGSITFQTWNLKGNYAGYFTGLVAAFEKEHPGTKVKWIDQPADGYSEKLSADAAAGTLPDVMDLGPEAGYTLAGAGKLLDIAKADPAAKADFLPAAWNAMTWPGIDGGTYGYPFYLNTGPSFFNTALMTKAGLDPKNLPKTYGELFTQAEKMAGSAKGAYSMLGRTPVIETFGTYGVELMDKDATAFTFNSAKGVELLTRYKELYDAGALTEDILNEKQVGEVDKFKAGELGWLPGSAYNLADFKKNAPDIYRSVAIGPIVADAAPNMYIESLAVSSKTGNVATAVAFAKFATNRANQLAFAHRAAIFPATRNTLDDPYFTKDDGTDEGRVRVEAAAQIGRAVVYWPPAFSQAMVDELREQVALALKGEKSPKKALDDTVAFCNDKLRRA